MTYCGSGGNENSLSFSFSYVGISIKVFAVGVLRWSYFLASDYGTFLLVICMNLVIRNGPSTYVIEKTSFVKIKVDTRVARELSYSALPCTSSGDKNWRRY
jgi:hypothetical protein